MIVILGPTACGKTKLAAQLAHRIGGEIISADSRQVYRRMDIGTGKDLADYVVDGQSVPYHLIDIAEPGERYNAYRFQQDFLQAYEGITAERHRPAILCGGTGLYIESVVKGYGFNTGDAPRQGALQLPEAHIFGINIPRDLRRQRITERLHQRLSEGMVEEVQGLLNEGVPVERLLAYGLEYGYITRYLTGQMPYDTMVERLEIAIHQFAKRQMTWFRGMEERRGIPIHWLDYALPNEEKIKEIVKLTMGPL